MSSPNAIPATSSVPQLDQTPVTPLRRNMRFEPEPGAQAIAFATAAGLSFCGEIANESYSGLAVTVADVEGLQKDQLVIVQYYGHPVRGFVRRIALQDNGRWSVGVEWK